MEYFHHQNSVIHIKLRRVGEHTFLPADLIINRINHKLSYLPEWKRHHFTIRYIEVDRKILSESLVIRQYDGDKKYLYLKSNYNYERLIENQVRNMVKRPDIVFRIPLTKEHWKNLLHKPDSQILAADPERYNEILDEQSEICAKIFPKPVSVISGGAGTGKTTLINAFIMALERVEGTGAIIQLLAPTGKATDRIREITGRENASTIHSFLAKNGWLNDNLTFKLEGGNLVELSTIIIDEASMLDLALIGTLFRAINWATVKRIVFVGDPNQLPPIGCGKIFADLLDWLVQTYPENVGILKTNIRQLLNLITNKGTGILELASLYIRKQYEEVKDNKFKFDTEKLFRKIQEGGDIDNDLRVLYWNGLDELQEKLINIIINDLESDTGLEFDDSNPYEIWATAFKINDFNNQEPDYNQIISPYRGDFFGVDNLNVRIQSIFNKDNIETKGNLNGITFFDKVIQYRNRTRSNPIIAYNTNIRKPEKIEVFNGEIGFVKFHAYDSRRWFWTGFRPTQFQVIFKRKQHLWVEYTSNSEVENNLELAYAISVHKAQGSEFNRIYFILPKSRKSLLSTELFYTGITRALSHSTLLIEEDYSPLLTLLRPEFSQMNKINSSLFEFKPIPEEFLNLREWYEEGKVHRTLTNEMVRSKSEVIIANLLHDKGVPFSYEVPLYAPDGTFYIPDFTIVWAGEKWYWEHLGLLDKEEYRNHWNTKKEWYKENGFIGRLVITEEEEGIDSIKIKEIIEKYFTNLYSS